MLERKVFSMERVKKIGDQTGNNWSEFDIEQFRRGMDVELEHGVEDSFVNVINSVH